MSLYQNFVTRQLVLLLIILLPLVPLWSRSITYTENHVPAAVAAQPVSVAPRELNFDAVRIGSSVILNIKIYNNSSETVLIRTILSDNSSFTPMEVGNVSVSAFSNREIGVKFQPTKKGRTKGTIQINLDVKGRNKFKIKLSGEGLGGSIVVATPGYINTVASKGEVVRQILTLTNTTSVEHEFRIEPGKDRSTLLFPSMPDSTVFETGFENFSPGPLDGQNGWTSMPGWDISTLNADEGIQHLRGTAMMAGSEFNLVAPAAFDDSWRAGEEHYSTFTSRLNLDNAAGATWEITLRDTYGILVGRITINPDRTIDMESSGANYARIDTRLDAAAIPSQGYFTIIFELIWGDNEINPWNSMNFYIDGNRIFKGYSMGGTIGNVSVKCNPETTSATLDMDNLRIGLGNYSPDYITVSPSAGTIRAGESIELDVTIDPASLEFRTYTQNIVAYIDEADTVLVPVSFEVTGKPWLAIQAPAEMNINRDRNSEEIYLLNMGGREIHFTAQGVRSYLTATPASGIIPREGVVVLRVGNGWSIPGTYTDTLKITTDIEGFPVFSAPVSIRIDPPEEYATLSGDSATTFETETTPIGLTLYPNPAEPNALITLQIPGRVSVEVVRISIMTTTGKVAYTSQETLKGNRVSFTVSELLKPGMYLVMLERGQRIYAQRFVVR